MTQNQKTLLIGGIIVLGFLLIVLNKKEVSAPMPDSFATTTSTTTSTSSTSEEDIVTSQPSTTNQTMVVKIAMVDLGGTNGTGASFGCGDKISLLNRTVPQSTGTLHAALTELLSIHQQTVSGKYNALASSNLVIDSLSITPQGEAKIDLTGTFSLGGTCDTPRFKEQIKATAQQFSTVSSVSIKLNGTPIDQALSSQ